MLHVLLKWHSYMVCSQEAEVTEKSDAHNPSVRYVTKDPRTLPQAIKWNARTTCHSLSTTYSEKPLTCS